MNWNRQYVVDRVREKLYRQRNQGLPWLTQDAIKILQDLIKKDDVMLELGSGRSTIWFSKNCKHITSVENIEEWHKKIAGEIAEQNLSNIDYIFAKDKEEAPFESDYVKVIDNFDEESLDIVLVDGFHRVECAIKSIPKIKQTGILIIDNINWYLPNKSNAPASLKDKSKQLPEWIEFEKLVDGWRRIWTDNGVSCTAFYFKPMVK